MREGARGGRQHQPSISLGLSCFPWLGFCCRQELPVEAVVLCGSVAGKQRPPRFLRGPRTGIAALDPHVSEGQPCRPLGPTPPLCPITPRPRRHDEVIHRPAANLAPSLSPGHSTSSSARAEPQLAAAHIPLARSHRSLLAGGGDVGRKGRCQRSAPRARVWRGRGTTVVCWREIALAMRHGRGTAPSDSPISAAVSAGPLAQAHSYSSDRPTPTPRQSDTGWRRPDVSGGGGLHTQVRKAAGRLGRVARGEVRCLEFDPPSSPVRSALFVLLCHCPPRRGSCK